MEFSVIEQLVPTRASFVVIGLKATPQVKPLTGKVGSTLLYVNEIILTPPRDYDVASRSSLGP